MICLRIIIRLRLIFYVNKVTFCLDILILFKTIFVVICRKGINNINNNTSNNIVKIDDDNVITFTPDRIAQELLNSKKELVKYTGRRGGWLTNNYEANKTIFDALGFVPKTSEVFQPNNIDVGEIVSKVKSTESGKVWCYVKFPTGEGVYNETKLKDATPDINKLIFFY